MPHVHQPPTLERLLHIVKKRHPELTLEQQNTLAQQALNIYTESRYLKFHLKTKLLVKIAYARSLIPRTTNNIV